MSGWWIVAGSLTFLVGASIAVPSVFTQPDPEARLALLQAGLTRWRLGQPLYVLGPALVAVGVGVRAGEVTSAAAGLHVAAAAVLMAGVAFWAIDVALRTVRVRDFALGRLPGWPFVGYVVLTCAGLALFGAGLWREGQPAWLGGSVVVLGAAFLVLYAAMRDIPPFVFYLLTLAIAVVLQVG